MSSRIKKQHEKKRKQMDEQNQKNQYEKKTKKIMKQKNKRPTNQVSEVVESSSAQQKRRNITPGITLGRPRNEKKKFQTTENPAMDAEQILLNYLSQIGLKHGIVFQPEQRMKLQEENKGRNQNFIAWNNDHEWNKERQYKKILKNQEAMKIIKFMNENKGIPEEQLLSIFLNFSSLFADQCTDQVYIILTQILKSIYYDKQNEEESRRKAEKLFDGLRFFSGDFTKLFIKYWIQITGSREWRQQIFIKMYLELKAQMERVMEEFEQLQQYLQEQRIIDKKLKAIANEQKNKNHG